MSKNDFDFHSVTDKLCKRIDERNSRIKSRIQKVLKEESLLSYSDLVEKCCPRGSYRPPESMMDALVKSTPLCGSMIVCYEKIYYHSLSISPCWCSDEELESKELKLKPEHLRLLTSRKMKKQQTSPYKRVRICHHSSGKGKRSRKSDFYVPISIRKKFDMKQGDMFWVPINFGVLKLKFYSPSNFYLRSSDKKEMGLEDWIDVDFSNVEKVEVSTTKGWCGWCDV